jgi:hypothetical protein
MGAAISRSISVSNIVNESIMEILMESSTSCQTQSIATQDMLFSDIQTLGCDVDFSNISQTADVSINLACAQSSELSSDLQNKFKAKLDEKIEAETKGTALGFNNAQSASITQAVNKVKNSISMESVVECISQSIIQQKAEFSKINAICYPGQKVSFRNIKQVILSTQINNCINSNNAATKAITELQTDIDKVIKSKTEGITMMASLGSGASSVSSVIVIGLVLMFGIQNADKLAKAAKEAKSM